jgi:invasion protein IalB
VRTSSFEETQQRGAPLPQMHTLWDINCTVYAAAKTLCQTCGPHRNSKVQLRKHARQLASKMTAERRKISFPKNNVHTLVPAEEQTSQQTANTLSTTEETSESSSVG